MGTKADRFGFYLRGRTWYTCDPVSKRDVSTRCTDLEAAQKWRRARERLAADPAAAAAERATLGDECRMMLDALAALSRPTAYYEGKLGHWTRVLGNNCPLSQVGPDAVDRFIAQRRDEGVTNHTISKELKCLITTLRNAKRAGRYALAVDTLRPLGFTASYVPRTRTLSLFELDSLLAGLGPEDQAFVVLCVALGLRRSETLRLVRSDFDLEQWVVRVRGTKTKGSRRDLPILAPFRPLVVVAVERLPFTGAVRGTNYLRALAKACQAAGLAPVTANDLRRTHATLLRDQGVDADTTRQLLGHSRKSQTLEVTYDKPRPAALAARAGDLSPLGAALAPLADSLQPPLKRVTSSEGNPDLQRPWGPIS